MAALDTESVREAWHPQMVSFASERVPKYKVAAGKRVALVVRSYAILCAFMRSYEVVMS